MTVKNQPRYLLVQLADIGNLVLTTSAISALREAQPNAHIALLTSSHAVPVVQDSDLVDEIIVLDRKGFNSSKSLFKPSNLRQIWALRGGRYDTVIFFHHFTLKLGTLKFAMIAFGCGAKRRIGLQNGNAWFLTDRVVDEGFGAKHQAQYWLDLVALAGASATPRPTVMATQDDVKLPDHDGLRIVIHAGSGGYSLARRWEPEKFAQVADRLHDEHGAQIILVGGNNDNVTEVKSAMQHQAIDLSNKTTLPQLAGVIQQSDLYIGADSGVLHIASTTKTPVLSLFGSSNHEAWSAWTPESPATVIRSAPECSPCSYVEHGIGLRDGCPARTCMKMISVEQVVESAKRLLEGKIQIDTKSHPIKAYSNRIHILDLPVDGITYEEWLDLIDEWIQEGKRAHHVCTTNPEFTIIAQKDTNFRNILKRADLCVPDGVGLLWAAKRKGTPLPQQVTGSDGVPIIAERASQKGWRLFLLGAGEGVANQTAQILKDRYPNLQIAGTYSGSPAPQDEDDIVNTINESHADILFVAYGAPEQDKWIARNLPRLQVSMAMGVGGAFDFITGAIPRAPLWMRKRGLEWLYRLYKQPWRIKRMLRLPRFALAVLLQDR